MFVIRLDLAVFSINNYKQMGLGGGCTVLLFVCDQIGLVCFQYQQLRAGGGCGVLQEALPGEGHCQEHADSCHLTPRQATRPYRHLH